MSTQGNLTPAGRSSFYDPSLSSDFQSNMWKTAPLLEWMHDPSIGVFLNEDFTSYDATATTGDYLLTQSTTGAAAISTAASGVLEVDSNSTTVVQGANLQRIKAAFVPAAGKHIWFETSIKVVDTFDKAELFVGLSERDTTLIATSANSSANHIGWQCVTDDGVLLFTSEKAGAGDTGAAATIAEATYIKLGFYVDGITSVTQYINGVESGTAKATANVPIVAVYPSFVCQSGGTNDPILHVAGYRVFQLR